MSFSTTYNSTATTSSRWSKRAFSYAVFVSFSASDFTGKELDEETGYGYFGARYMDHELMTGWLSVDPMADKYPNISPYAYCAWNPMKLVDPDGNEAIDVCDWYRDQTGVVVWDDEVKSQEDLTQGCTYLGTEGVAVNEHGDVTRVYNSDGTTEEIPQTLPPVTITENKNHCSADIAANIPAALTVALYDGPELGPADLLAGVVTGALAIASAICWIYDIITALAVDESYIEQYNEHTKGTRNSTYDKHTKRRSGQVTGKQRNENRGDKNRKYQPKLNPNKKSKNES